MTLLLMCKILIVIIWVFGLAAIITIRKFTRQFYKDTDIGNYPTNDKVWLRDRLREERKQKMDKDKLSKKADKMSLEIRKLIDKNPLITIGEAIVIARDKSNKEVNEVGV